MEIIARVTVREDLFGRGGGVFYGCCLMHLNLKPDNEIGKITDVPR
jgi:hypothetical protein